MNLLNIAARTLAAALVTFCFVAGAFAQCHGGNYGPSYGYGYDYGYSYDYGYQPYSGFAGYDDVYLKQIYVMLDGNPQLAAQHAALYGQLKLKFAPAVVAPAIAGPAISGPGAAVTTTVTSAVAGPAGPAIAGGPAPTAALAGPGAPAAPAGLPAPGAGIPAGGPPAGITGSEIIPEVPAAPAAPAVAP